MRRRSSSFTIPRYKFIDPGFESDGDDLDYQASPPGPSKGKERERDPSPVAATTPPPRGTKRRRPKEHNLGFLSPPSTSAFSVPSSDLLKCIHHFACQYYSERGQLFNDTRIYRKEKKRRRLAKLAAEQAAQSDVQDSQENEENPVPDGEPDNPVQDSEPAPRKMRDPGNRRRDMYKTLDGSALLAVGMLLQEHIGRILTATIPDGWEDGLEENSEAEDEDSIEK